MNKREAIIYTAANLIHQRGYHHVGIKTILDELEIPKGSFYHYFKSKEDLGIAIINMYTEAVTGDIQGFENSIDGLRLFFNSFFDRLRALELKRGCPIGNLILELSDENEIFREALLVWYNTVENWVIEVLSDAGYSDANQRAKGLMAAFEGTMLLVKLDKKEMNFDIFNSYVFDAILLKK